jgi:hypothetical protein
MRRTRLPLPILVVSCLSLAYVPLRVLLVDAPRDRPLPDPYYLLEHLESDATLRSASFGDRAETGKIRGGAWFQFDREAALPQTGGRAVAARSADGFRSDRGSLLLSAESASVGGWKLEAEAGFERPPASLVVEGRLRSTDPLPAEDWSIIADVHWWPAAGIEPSLRAELVPANDLQQPDATLEFPPIAAGEWIEFQIVLRGPASTTPPAAPHGLRARVQLLVGHPTPSLQVDELLLRAGTQLDLALAGGHAPRTGVTEATRDLKRRVRLGSDERLCLVLEGPATLTYTCTVPPAARLSFGLSALSDSPQRGSTDLTVAISREGEFEHSLLHTSVRASDPAGFRDHHLDLARFAGDLVRLQFRMASSATRQAPMILLADPVLVSEPLDPSAPHVVVAFHAGGTAPRGGHFPRLEAESVRVGPAAASTGDAELDILCSLAGSPLPALPPPLGAVPQIAAEHRTLEEALRLRGYRSVIALDSPRGWALQGSSRCVHGPVGDRVQAALDFLTDVDPLPAFAAVDLGTEAAGGLQQLYTGLEARGILGRVLLVVAPIGAESATTEPILFRLPNLPQRGTLASSEWNLTDLVPTVLGRLGWDPAAYPGSDRLVELPVTFTADQRRVEELADAIAAERPPGMAWVGEHLALRREGRGHGIAEEIR